MSKKRVAKRSYAEWDLLVDEWGVSGLTQSEFAKAHGINPRTFQGRVWKSRKRRGIMSKGQGVPSHFVEVSPPSPVESTCCGECRITMNNTQVEFSSSSDAAWIGEILQRLGHGR